jgi:hypothetical protein
MASPAKEIRGRGGVGPRGDKTSLGSACRSQSTPQNSKSIQKPGARSRIRKSIPDKNGGNTKKNEIEKKKKKKKNKQ